jgi:hypothetical protein
LDQYLSWLLLTFPLQAERLWCGSECHVQRWTPRAEHYSNPQRSLSCIYLDALLQTRLLQLQWVYAINARLLIGPRSECSAAFLVGVFMMHDWEIDILVWSASKAV